MFHISGGIFTNPSVRQPLHFLFTNVNCRSAHVKVPLLRQPSIIIAQRKPRRRQWQRERYETVGLTKENVLHVPYKFCHISFPFSAKQHDIHFRHTPHHALICTSLRMRILPTFQRNHCYANLMV